jgi:hypothetical protein
MDAADGTDDASSAQEVPAFAPNALNDDRHEGDWKTRYGDKDALTGIRLESAYVLICLVLSVGSIAAVAICDTAKITPLPHAVITALQPYVLSFLGGFLGGTLFTMKWLYHSVAKGVWNRDRRLWRLFTPLLSAGAALTIILLCSSGVLPFFGPNLAQSSIGALGLSIVFGYFSDRAFSSLENLLSGIGMRRSRQPKSSGNPKSNQPITK